MVKAQKWFTWIVFCSINILILEDDMKKSYYFQSDGDGGILKFFLELQQVIAYSWTIVKDSTDLYRKKKVQKSVDFWT